MLFIGIDPGVSGGIAVLNENGDPKGAFKMPETRRDTLEALRAVRASLMPVRAMVERVNPGVFGRGKVGKMGAVSAFTFGRNVERVLMALEAADIPYDEVLPVKWQTELGCRSRGDKNVTKARAQALFPVGVKVTHATADALLIAEYCRRVRRRMFE